MGIPRGGCVRRRSDVLGEMIDHLRDSAIREMVAHLGNTAVLDAG
jgi:hypothetical protein